MTRPFAHFDWSLRSCGAHGHVTYAPTEADLAARLSAQTAVGEAWRCLRCEAFVPGPAGAHGAAQDAPIVLRGRALRDATILRVLAVERFLRGLFLLALAYGVYRFNGAKDSIQRILDQDLPALQSFGDRIGINLADSTPVNLVEKALGYDNSTLVLFTIGVAAYGVLELVEGTGLWLLKRWGEYVAVVATAAFIPYELYELVDSLSAFKAVLFAVNVAAVVYLLYSKRLFGLRGGHSAFEAERSSASVLEVERAALDPQSRESADTPTSAGR